MSRQITWFRRESGFALPPMSHGSKPRTDFHSLGIVQVSGEPVYDNGAYFVIDTVKDLEWTVVSNDMIGMRIFPLDKYAAIEWADQLKESEERQPA